MLHCTMSHTSKYIDLLRMSFMLATLPDITELWCHPLLRPWSTALDITTLPTSAITGMDIRTPMAILITTLGGDRGDITEDAAGDQHGVMDTVATRPLMSTDVGVTQPMRILVQPGLILILETTALQAEPPSRTLSVGQSEWRAADPTRISTLATPTPEGERSHMILRPGSLPEVLPDTPVTSTADRELQAVVGSL